MPTDYGKAIDELASEITEITEQKGFNTFDEFTQVIVKVALIGTEVSEALGVHRERYTDGEVDGISEMTENQEADFTEELADIVIRVLDLAGYLSLPIGDSIVSKIEKNRSRAPLHGKRY